MAGGAVPGSLWEVEELATLCFMDRLYHLMHTRPELPWHRLLAEARHALRTMSVQELSLFAREQGIDASSTGCCGVYVLSERALPV